MSKIEYNPRKSKHLDFLHTMIIKLHADIFQGSFELVQNPYTTEADGLRIELKTKIELYKKYSRRLRLIEL